MTQEEKTAAWMGVSVEVMNRDHEDIHRMMQDVLNVRSHSLRIAAGERINYHDYCLANLEEAAVIAVQRYWYAATGKSDPASFV